MFILAKKKTIIDKETGEVMAGTATAKVANIADHKSELQKLKKENEKLSSQVYELVMENIVLRKQVGQPESGPLVPSWIKRETVEKINDPDWYYRALDEKGIPMVLEKKSGKWLRLGRATYIRHYGEIPNNYSVFPVDGNSRNCEPENLVAMPKKEFFDKTGWTFDVEGNAIRESELTGDE